MSFKKFLLAVWHGIEYPFTHAAAIGEILSKLYNGTVTVIEDEPEAHSLIVGLVQQFEMIAPDVVAAVAADGLNAVTDAKAVQDVANLFTYFKDTFFPGIEKIYEDLKTDVTGTAQPTAPALAAAPDPAAPETASAAPASAKVPVVLGTRKVLAPGVIQHG